MIRKLTLTLLLLGFATIASAQVQTRSAVLTWIASTTQSVGYNVYRSNMSGGCSPAPPVGATCTKMNQPTFVFGTLFTDPTIVVGQDYFYVIRTTKDGVESVNSNEVTTGIVQPPPPGLTPPVSVTVIVK